MSSVATIMSSLAQLWVRDR